MPLNFQPPTDIINMYLDANQRSLTGLNQSLQNVATDAQRYYMLKQRDKELALRAQEEQRQREQLGITKDIYAREYNPSLLPGVNEAFMAPTAAEEQAQQSLPGEHIIGHWNNTVGSSYVPKSAEEQRNIQFAGEYPYGIKGQQMTEDTIAQFDNKNNVIGYSKVTRPIKGRTLLAKPTAEPRTQGLGLSPDRANLKYIEDFNKDSGVIRAKQGLDGAENVRQLATSGNPIAAAAIPTYMARASGEVGNLSEPDKAPFGGSRAILTRLDASLKQLSEGQLTEENKRFLIDLAGVMESSANKNLDRRARDMARQFSKVHGEKPESIFESLRPQRKFKDEIGESPTQRKARLLRELSEAQK